MNLVVLFTITVVYTFDAACEKMNHIHHHLLAYIIISPSGLLVYTDNVRSA